MCFTNKNKIKLGLLIKKDYFLVIGNKKLIIGQALINIKSFQDLHIYHINFYSLQSAPLLYLIATICISLLEG